SRPNGDFPVTGGQGTVVQRLTGESGEPTAARKVDAGDFRGTLTPVRALPGDRAVLCNGISYGSRGWYYRIAALDPRTGKVRFILDDGGNPAYSPTGHLLFTRGDVLLAAPFDLGRLALTGPPVPILNGLLTRLAV